MDLLPIELLHLVFQHCDGPTVRSLRLVSSTLADVGYDYLIPPHFNAVGYRDDVKRLHSIAAHERLRSRISSVTFNFTELDELHARQASYRQYWVQGPEERAAMLHDAWIKYDELEDQANGLPPFHTQAWMLEDAFKQLPKLDELEVTYSTCPHSLGALKGVFAMWNCRKRDRSQACKNINAIVSAVRHTRLSSLTIDMLPLEVFKLGEDRRHWFDCARSFTSLSRLDLVLDPPETLLPSAHFRITNGLGHILQFTPDLTHLSLRFHVYHDPRAKFPLSFRELLGDFTWRKLTDLKLEGISCGEEDLRAFLMRHGPTLERLRLGGRGLAKPYELSIGGVHLHEGTFRSLFLSLRGRLPRLQRFHMEGDFEGGEPRTRSRRLYKFHAVTDDNWIDIRRLGPPRPPTKEETIDSSDLEQYLIHGGEFPRLVVPGSAAAA